MKIIFEVPREEDIEMSITAGTHMSEMPEAEEVEIVYLSGAIAAVVEKTRIEPLLKSQLLLAEV